MSSYPPPDPNVSIFNNLYWQTGATVLTKEIADKYYLKYPTAQGDENFPFNVEIEETLIVNGTSTVNNNSIINGAGHYLQFPDGSKQYTASVMPTGIILPWGGNTTAPTGFLFCNGATVSRTTYATLFSIIGTTYGTGDGSTTFTLPNLLNRAPFGSASTANTGIVVNGGQLGVIYPPTIYGGNQTIATGQLASHTHNLSFNTGSYVNSTNNTNNTTTGGSSTRLVSSNSSSFPTETGTNSNLTPNFGQSDFLPPFCCVSYIIKY